MRTFARDFIGILVLASIIFVLLRLVVGACSVANQSMEPSLQAGECLLVNKMAYRFEEPSRGDVVHYRIPGQDDSGVKRIIGLPGDYVEIRNSSVYVNGIKLIEPYVKNQPSYDLLAYQVPPGCFLVLGDNRNYNDPSESWIVPRDDIIGRAWIYTWPPDKWGKVQNYPLNTQMVAVEAP
jgi:signal peptidase I